MSSKDVEEVFTEMKKKGEASVENLVKRLKDAKILERAHRTEAEARAMFKGAQKDSEVSLEIWKQVVNDLAKDAKISQEQLAQQLMQTTSSLLEAFNAASQAFTNIFKK